MRLAAARREKYKAELMADILAAAREIFVQDGYEGFTIRKLAERIGCSPGNIYLYFKDKSAIFDHLVEESFALLLAALPQPDQTKCEDPVALLKRGLRAYVNFGLDHPDHYRFSFLMQPAIQPRPRQQIQRNILRLSRSDRVSLSRVSEIRSSRLCRVCSCALTTLIA
jgi:AcrR family transcriptional regulator